MHVRYQILFVSVLALLLSDVRTFAVEELVWKLGEPDRSDHEFNATRDVRAREPVSVRIGAGQETAQWPNFHPGSGNEIGRAHV